MKKRIIILAIFGLASIIDVQAQVSKLKVKDTFDIQEFTTMSGEKISLESIENKVFVMNFWSEGCRGCEIERPYLNEILHDYEGKEVVFWSITLNEKDEIKSFLKDHPIDWEIKGGVDFMGLTGDQTFLIKAMPMTIVVNRKRKVLLSHTGAILEGETGDAFTRLLDEALAQ